MARQLSAVVVMELSERAALLHRVVMTHNAPCKNHTSGPVSCFCSACPPALLVTPQTQVCSFLFYQALYRRTSGDAVNDVDDAHTHTHGGIPSLFRFWKKEEKVTSNVNLRTDRLNIFGSVLTTETEFEILSLHYQMLRVPMSTRGKMISSFDFYLIGCSPCVRTNTLRSFYFSPPLVSPSKPFETVPVAVKVSSNRSHSCLTEERAPCKQKTEKERACGQTFNFKGQAFNFMVSRREL